MSTGYIGLMILVGLLFGIGLLLLWELKKSPVLPLPLRPVPVEPLPSSGVRRVDKIEMSIAAEGRLCRADAAWLIARIWNLEQALRERIQPHGNNCAVEANDGVCDICLNNRAIKAALAEPPRFEGSADTTGVANAAGVVPSTKVVDNV